LSRSVLRTGRYAFAEQEENHAKATLADSEVEWSHIVVVKNHFLDVHLFVVLQQLIQAFDIAISNQLGNYNIE
jgi:hypothetical protein